MSGPERTLLLPAILLVLAAPISQACWFPVSEPFPGEWGAPVDLWADPVHPERWVVATREGVAVSDDDGRSFEFRPLGSLHSLLVDPDDPDRFWATTGPEQVPRLKRSDDRGRSWGEVATLPGRGIWTLGAAFRDGTCLLAVQDYRLGCYWRLEMYRSEDSGRSWIRHGTGHGIEGCWIHPVPFTDVVFTKRNELYRDRLLRSTDAGESWDGIPLPESGLVSSPVALGVGGGNGEELVLLDQVMEGELRGVRLLRSTDVGASWTEIESGFLRFWNMERTETLLVTPASEIFLCPEYGDYYHHCATLPVVYSPDAGSTWVPAAGGLPPGSELPHTVAPSRRIVQPLWDSTGPSALIYEPGSSLRLYRYDPDPPIPRITLAGWVPDRISASTGGSLTLQAIVPPLPGRSIEVEILHQGCRTGVFLQHRGDGYYWLDLQVEPDQLVPGYLAVGLLARDSEGVESPPWPDLAYRRAQDPLPLVPPAWTGSPPTGLGGSQPRIQLGGFGFSGGFCQDHPAIDLVAFLEEPDGAYDVSEVEVMWRGLPTGLTLSRSQSYSHSSYLGSFCRMPGCWGKTIPLTNTPPGSYVLELQGRDTAGNRTGLWPYLTVDP